MATNISMTRRDDRSGLFNSQSVSGSGSSVILDTANDVTSSLASEGYKQHDWSYTVASVGTNVVVVIERQLTPGGSWVECGTGSTRTANGTYVESFTGFAVATRLKLKSISTGTPNLQNITGVASDPYSR